MRTSACVLFVAMLAAVGCTDQDAQSQAASAEQFQKTAAILDDANRGFVPKDVQVVGKAVDTQALPSTYETASGPMTLPDMVLYRQQKYEEALKEFQAIQDQGSATQRVAVRRMIAEILASQARHEFELALANDAHVAAQSATLLSFMVAATRANARLQSAPGEEAGLLAALTERQTQLKNQIAQDTAQLAAQNKAISETQAGIADHAGKRDQANQQAQELTVTSLQQKGDDQFKTDVAAIQARGQSEAHAAQSDILNVQLYKQRSELNILSAQQAAATQALSTVEGQLAALKKRQDDAQALRNSALQERGRIVMGDAQAGTKGMVAMFNELIATHDQRVIKPMQVAQKRMTQSQDVLADAINLAGAAPELRASLDFESLARQSEKARMYVEQAQSGATLSLTCRIIADQSAVMNLEQAGPIGAASEELKKAVDQLISDAKATIGLGIEKVKTIREGSDDTARARAADIEKQLANYAKRLEAAVNPPTELPAPAAPAPAEPKAPAEAPAPAPAG